MTRLNRLVWSVLVPLAACVMTGCPSAKKGSSKSENAHAQQDLKAQKRPPPMRTAGMGNPGMVPRSAPARPRAAPAVAMAVVAAAKYVKADLLEKQEQQLMHALKKQMATPADSKELARITAGYTAAKKKRRALDKRLKQLDWFTSKIRARLADDKRAYGKARNERKRTSLRKNIKLINKTLEGYRILRNQMVKRRLLLDGLLRALLTSKGVAHRTRLLVQIEAVKVAPEY